MYFFFIVKRIELFSRLCVVEQIVYLDVIVVVALSVLQIAKSDGCCSLPS